MEILGFTCTIYMVSNFLNTHVQLLHYSTCTFIHVDENVYIHVHCVFCIHKHNHIATHCKGWFLVISLVSCSTPLSMHSDLIISLWLLNTTRIGEL